MTNDLPYIALCLIVKNEEKTLPRLFASLRGKIDYWVIVDTGSTDTTIDVIHSELAGVPGELHERPWVNFGHNRTELMQLAKDKARWLLCLDADDIATGTMPQLSEYVDAYMVYYNNTPAYSVPRLVRGNRDWKYTGVTHEYLDSAEEFLRAPLTGFTVIHMADGGSRSDKFERDRRLLEKDVEENPSNLRSLFYLGQTYFNLGEYEKAIEVCRQRAGLGGWEEEVYYAQFTLGRALDLSGNKDSAISAWIAAWQLRPQRLEAVHAVIRELRERGNYRAAWALAESVVGAHIPLADILFVHRDVWLYELPLEHSICAYYVQGPVVCLKESEAILDIPQLPRHVRGFAELNAKLSRELLATTNSASNGSQPYDTKFFSSQNTGSRNSALRVLPIAFELVHPSSVIDIGCGVGPWLDVCTQLGISQICGVDGDYVKPDQLEIPAERFVSADISSLSPEELKQKLPAGCGPKFDMVMSLEVAEHLFPESAEDFITLLCGMSSVVLFSAAIPGQGGTHHVNEQFPSYWVKLFADHGYVPIDAIRQQIWTDRNIEWWYRQNVMLFASTDALIQYPSLGAARAATIDSKLDLVHPETSGVLMHSKTG